MDYVIIGISTAVFITTIVTLCVIVFHNRRTYALQKPSISITVSDIDVAEESDGEYEVLLKSTIYSRQAITINATFLVGQELITASFKDSWHPGQSGDKEFYMKAGIPLPTALSFTCTENPKKKKVYLRCCDHFMNQVFGKDFQIP